MAALHDDRATTATSSASGRRRRRVEGPHPAPRAGDVRDLRALLDRGRLDTVAKYRRSITSILGGAVDARVFAGDSVAGASLLGDLSVPGSTAFVHATSFTCGAAPPARGPPAVARTGRRRGDAPSAKEAAESPATPARVRKSGRGQRASRGRGRLRSSKLKTKPRTVGAAETEKKPDPPSSPPPVSKGEGEGEGNGHAATSRCGHARTSRGGAAAATVRQGRVAQSLSAAAEEARPTAAVPVFRYNVGDRRVSRAHSIHFDSPAQAAALLGELPPGSGLFARRSDQRFTYAVLLERRDEGDGDAASLVVALDGDGAQKKVLRRRHWKTCLRLVHPRAAGNGRRQ